MNRSGWSIVKVTVACAMVAALLSVVAHAAAASAPVQLDLKVLLVGDGASDPTTAAWQSALSQEGVPYTLATAAGTYGAETVTLPALTTGSTGNFNGVVIADSPFGFATGQLTALDTTSPPSVSARSTATPTRHRFSHRPTYRPSPLKAPPVS